MEKTWRNSASIRDMHRARLRAAGGPCHICGEPIDYSLKTPDPMSFEIEHIKSRHIYPDLAFDPKNMAPAHRKCNRAKSDKEFAPIIRRSGALK